MAIIEQTTYDSIEEKDKAINALNEQFV
jgi:hypothetical protein